MPGSLSKSFYAAFGSKTCRDLVHPDFTCSESIKKVFLEGFKGSMAFYFPICFLPMLFKIKDWNKIETWKDFFVLLARSFTVGYTTGTIVFVLICLSFKIFKRFYLPVVVWLPASIGASFAYLLPKKMLHVEGLGMFNMYLEFVIKQSKTNLVIAVRQSRTIATLAYSLLNGVVMHGIYKVKSNRFWFINSTFKHNKVTEDLDYLDKSESSENNVKCHHNNLTCENFIKQELKKTIEFAFGLGVLKTVLPRIKSLFTNPKVTLVKCVQKFDYGLFMFLVSSNGLFKYLLCQLNQRSKLSVEINSLLAGFASGLSYCFYPKYIIFTWGISSAIEMIFKSYEAYCKDNKKQLPTIMKLINKIPMTNILFAFGVGIMFQLRIMYPYYVNKFVLRMMNAGSAGKVDKIAENYAAVMMGLK